MSVTIVVEHLMIVFFTLLVAIAVGVPLGILAYYLPRLRQPVLWTTDLLQTVPSLALLGLIMIVFGAGKTTTITGLVLYSLLPIVSNTLLGLTTIDPAVIEAAVGIGMNRGQRLFRVLLPLAFPSIFSGVRIATVTAVGSAVFAAFVGGGGLGSIIYRGIRIQNIRLMLSGTLTLMAIAILFDAVMSFVEKRLHKRTEPVPEAQIETEGI